MKLRNLLGLTAIIFLVCLFSINHTYANVQIILKGTVIDEYSGQPMAVTLEFRMADGKKFKIKSNSKDGTYQQVLNSGESFDIVFSNYDIVRKIEKVSLPNASQFIEHTVNFKVKKLYKGLKLLNLAVFEPMQSETGSSVKQALAELDEIMKFNRAVRFELVVNAEDSYSKVLTKETVKLASKKGKKKDAAPSQEKVTVKEPDAAAVRQLVDKRVEALKTYLSNSFSYKDRVSVRGDYSIPDSPSEAGISSNPDVIVIVSDIKNQLD